VKILIVDDIPANLRLLRVLLEGQNIEVVEASNGVEGLAVLGNEFVDAIISDILMPQMDGYRFCAAVRRHERFCDTPFIFYTATYTPPGDQKLARDVGADKYLTKPAPLNEILKAIRTTKALPRNRLKAIKTKEVDVLKEYSQALVAKLENKCAELSATVERYDDLFDNAHDLILCVKPDGRLLYVNRTWRETLGYTETELPRLTLFDTVHPASRAKFQVDFQRLLAGERIARIETIFHAKTREPIAIEGSASPKITNGKAAAVRCIFRDVTDLKRTEATLGERNDQLQAAFQKALVAQLATGSSDERD
jgi:PAS domain S-box-containing protein